MTGRRHRADTEVAIVGGGPAGLTAAILLAQLGIDARVYERRSTTSRLPRAHLLNQRTMEIFADLGIAETVFESIGVAGDVYTMSPPEDNWHRVGWYTSLAGELPGQGKEIGHLAAWGGGPDRDRYAAANHRWASESFPEVARCCVRPTSPGLLHRPKNLIALR